MLLVVVVYAYPLLFLINTSLKSNTEFLVNPTGLVQSPQLGNFGAAWKQGNFAAYVLNSVLYTLVAAGLGTVMSLMIGFPVARGYVKHPRVWQGLFAAMLFLPNTLVTVFQLALRLGLYDTALGYILIMASGVGVGPLLVTGYLNSIPREIDEAAAMDGAGYLRYMFTFLPRLMDRSCRRRSSCRPSASGTTSSWRRSCSRTRRNGRSHWVCSRSRAPTQVSGVCSPRRH